MIVVDFPKQREYNSIVYKRLTTLNGLRRDVNVCL